MPDAGDGGGNGGFGVTREEFGAQTSRKSGVLYADFNGEGAFFGGIHAGQCAAVIAEDVAADIVCGDGENHNEG